MLRSAIQPCMLWACLHHCGTPLTQHLSDPVHACAGAACLVQLSAKLASARSNQWQSSSSCRCSLARHRHQDRLLSPTGLSLPPRTDQQSLAGIYTSVQDRRDTVSHVQQGAGRCTHRLTVRYACAQIKHDSTASAAASYCKLLCRSYYIQ